MADRTCPTCDTVFTPTHGRQRYCQPECRQDEHRKVEKTCDACGQTCMKSPTTRYNATYCSQLCRDYARWGGSSSTIPADHWARWWGRTSDWKPPAVTERSFQMGRCRDCETSIIEPANHTPSAYCSKTCARRVMKRTRRARETSAPGNFTTAAVMRQYGKQGSVCAYCRQHRGIPDPEHVTPLSRGGRNDMSNIVAACRPCNTDKSDMTLSEWADDRARRGLAPVDTELSGDAYRHLWHVPATGEAWRLRVA